VRLLGDFRQGGTVALEVLYCGGRQGVPIIQWYRMDPGGNAMFFLPPNPLPRDPPHPTAPTPRPSHSSATHAGPSGAAAPSFLEAYDPSPGSLAPSYVIGGQDEGCTIGVQYTPVRSDGVRGETFNVHNPNPVGSVPSCHILHCPPLSGFRNDSDSPPTIVPSHLEMQRLRSICHRNLSVLSFIISPQGVFIFFDDTPPHVSASKQDGNFSLCLMCD